MSSSHVRSAILVRPGDVRVVAVQRPPLGRDKVRVAVEQCGICASDVRRWTGAADQYPLPLQLGHEIAGTVIEVGPGVEGRSIGDRVAVWVPSTAEEHGVMGVAQEVVADARHCFAAASGARFAFLAEPLGRLIGTLCLAERVYEGHVVIVGGGFKALLATKLIAENFSPRSLTVSSSRSDALRLATRVGATHAASPEELPFVVGKVSDGCRADAAFELTGTPVGLDLALRCARRGGELVVGYGVGEPLRPVHDLLFENRISWIQGDRIDDATRLSWMETALGLLDGGLDPAPLVGPSFPLDQTAEAFEQAMRDVRRVVVTP